MVGGRGLASHAERCFAMAGISKHSSFSCTGGLDQSVLLNVGKVPHKKINPTGMTVRDHAGSDLCHINVAAEWRETSPWCVDSWFEVNEQALKIG